MLKKKDKNKLHKPKNTIVGGVKDENISIMSIKDKLELLKKISNTPFIKSHFKNSPFDKGPDDKYKSLQNFLEKNNNNYDVALQIIKYILMCLYLGDDECYYYLEKYIRSNRPNIPLQYYEDNDIIFPNIGIYNIGDYNNKIYDNNVNLLFENLKSKIDDDLGVKRKLGKFRYFVDAKYKYRLYLRINADNQDNPTIENVDLYVPNKYHESVSDVNIKKVMEGYFDDVLKQNNPDFKKVVNANIEIIIKDINTKNTDNEDIIVIRQNYKKELLNQDNLTGTMIIGFINSLYDTPIKYNEYEEHINQNILKFNTMFFINLFIKNNKDRQLHEDTLAELLAHLRRSAIGFYKEEQPFIKLVKESIYHNYGINEKTFQDDTSLVNKVTKIQAKASINEWIKNKDCNDQNNKTGINNILFYSFMLYNNTDNNMFGNNNNNIIIIQRLKKISKRWLNSVGIYIRDEVDNCNIIIDAIFKEKDYLEGFTLYTKESMKNLDKEGIDYNVFFTKFQKIAQSIKDIIPPTATEVKKKYNSSITDYKNKYNGLNSTDIDTITAIQKLSI